MPAPFKKGLDYWPRSAGLARDKKFRKAKLKYGPLAVLVYELLLDQLYGEEGYFIDYTDKEDVICGLLEGLQGKYQPSAEALEEITECLAACGLFDGGLFRRGIITSHRAQCVYYSATATRKSADIDYSKWLLTEAEMKKLSAKSPILQNFINRATNPINGPFNPVDRPDNSQSKGKESKTDDDDAGAGNPEFGEFLTHFMEVFFVPNRIQRGHLESMFGQHGAFNMYEALEETGKRNVRDPIAYMRTVLRTYELKEME